MDVPASEIGIPLTLSEGAGVGLVSFTVSYDPTLLEITGIAAGTASRTLRAPPVNSTSPARGGSAATKVAGPCRGTKLKRCLQVAGGMTAR